MKFISQRKIILLFRSSNMAAVNTLLEIACVQRGDVCTQANRELKQRRRRRQRKRRLKI